MYSRLPLNPLGSHPHTCVSARLLLKYNICDNIKGEASRRIHGTQHLLLRIKFLGLCDGRGQSLSQQQVEACHYTGVLKGGLYQCPLPPVFCSPLSGQQTDIRAGLLQSSAVEAQCSVAKWPSKRALVPKPNKQSSSPQTHAH